MGQERQHADGRRQAQHDSEQDCLTAGVVGHLPVAGTDESPDQRRRPGAHHDRVAGRQPIDVIRGVQGRLVRFAEPLREELVVVLNEQHEILLGEGR